MTNRISLFISLFIASTLWVNHAQAQQQKDSITQQTIDIYNIYQPELPAAAKIDLNAGLPNGEKTKPNLIYSIPSQNLNFSYSPIPLQPLAMGIDTSYYSLYNNYIKVGYGNHSTPLIQLGLSNGNKLPLQLGLNFNHISSKGDIEHQQFSKTNLLLHGKYFSPTHALHVEAGYNRNGTRFYGYDHTVPVKNEDSLKQVYNNIVLRVGLQNTKSNNLRIDYQPEIEFYSYFDRFNQSETSFSLDIPAQKYIGEDIYIGVAFEADLSKFKNDDTSFSNNIVSISPSFNIEKKKFKLHAGVTPTWSQGEFYLLPDILNETNLYEDKIILSSGWRVFFSKASFKNITGENPFIKSFQYMPNTRVAQRYTGIKGAINSHFTYNVKLASVDFSNKVLYLNDPAHYNKFNLLSEEKIKSFEFHAELGYALGDHFNTKISGSWYNYYDQETEAKPWGMRPFISNLSLQYSGINNLSLGAGLYAMSGSWYQDNMGKAHKTESAFDINLNGSYEIGNQFSIWLKADNLLNNHYQRWNKYPSIGLNVLGGIMFKF